MTKECEALFGQINEKLDRVDVYIRGDDVKPGLKHRVDTLEASNKWRGHVVFYVLTAIGSIASPVITALIVKQMIGE